MGSAIWRTETVTPTPGQPPELAIRADIEVPERRLAMSWSLCRNTDEPNFAGAAAGELGQRPGLDWGKERWRGCPPSRKKKREWRQPTI